MSKLKTAGVALGVSLVAAVSFTNLLPYRLMETEAVYQIESELDSTKSTLADTKQSLADLELKYKDSTTRNEGFTASLNVEKTKVGKLEDQVSELEGSLSKLKGEKRDLEDDLDETKEKLSATETKLEDISSTRDDLKLELKAAKKELKEATDLKAALYKATALEKTLQEIQGDREKLNSDRPGQGPEEAPGGRVRLGGYHDGQGRAGEPSVSADRRAGPYEGGL